jgi:hypothetical protein
METCGTSEATYGTFSTFKLGQLTGQGPFGDALYIYRHTLRGFVEMNKDRYEIIRIGVFGSAARDSMNEQSDIDVGATYGTFSTFKLGTCGTSVNKQITIF